MLIRSRSITRQRREWQGLGPVPQNIQSILGGNSRCIFRETFPGTDVHKFMGEPGQFFSNPGFYCLGREDNALGVSLSRPMTDLARLGWTSGLFQSRATSNLRQYNHQLTQYFTWAETAAIGLSGHYGVAGGVLSITPQLLTPAQRAQSGFFNPPTIDASTGSNSAGTNAAGPITLSINAGTLNSGSGTLDFTATVTSGGAIAIASSTCVNIPDYVLGSEPAPGSYQATGPNGAVAQVLININWNNFNRFVSLALTSGPCTMGLGCIEMLVELPNVVGAWVELYLIQANRRSAGLISGVGEVDPNEYVIGTGGSETIYNLQQHAHNGQGYGGDQTLTANPTTQYVSIICNMTVVGNVPTILNYTALTDGGTPVQSPISEKATDTNNGASPPLGLDPFREKYLILDYALGGNSNAFGGTGVIYAGVAPPPAFKIKRVAIYQNWQQAGP